MKLAAKIWSLVTSCKLLVTFLLVTSYMLLATISPVHAQCTYNPNATDQELEAGALFSRRACRGQQGPRTRAFHPAAEKVVRDDRAEQRGAALHSDAVVAARGPIGVRQGRVGPRDRRPSRTPQHAGRDYH